MSVGSIVGNLLVLCVPVGALCLLGANQRYGLLRGATAGIVVLVSFFMIRAAARTLGYPLPTGGALELLLFIAVVEEVAKYLAVRLPRSGTALPVAAATGVGFAALENIAYLMIPTTTFLLRIALAGLLHVGTTVAYGWTRRKSLVIAYAVLATAITVHTLFNWTLHHLTQF